MVLKHTTTKQKASHPIPQEAFDWYDEYAHGKISRREFLNRLGCLAVLGFSMTALVDALTPNYALAEQVSFNDPDIKATYETFPSPNGHGEGRGGAEGEADAAGRRRQQARGGRGGERV